ncbi:4'-phosphopantetheinyl transferase superfamily protein [Streptomyces sp. NPDC006283]|uniref:4'-phosphopantetheinyl transferase family protein n=1 Tax=Streptomyces sp. NPDC006283 TaxID=3156741 RepID=UPI0033BC8E20
MADDAQAHAPGAPHRCAAPRNAQLRTPQPLPGLELLWSGSVPDHAEEAAAQRHLLDASESARLAALRWPQDRDAYAVAHVTLRRLLAEWLGQAPETVPLLREPCSHCGGPHGRPYVPDSGVHFSLSHTRGMVLIALASRPVGVDVETLLGTPAVDELTSQLHPDEAAELAVVPYEARPRAFARCWTRKEAVLKALGVGLNLEPALTYVGTGAQPAWQQAWLLADVATEPGYAAAVAVRRPDRDPGDHRPLRSLS